MPRYDVRRQSRSMTNAGDHRPRAHNSTGHHGSLQPGPEMDRILQKGFHPVSSEQLERDLGAGQQSQFGQHSRSRGEYAYPQATGTTGPNGIGQQAVNADVPPELSSLWDPSTWQRWQGEDVSDELSPGPLAAQTADDESDAGIQELLPPDHSHLPGFFGPDYP